MGVCSSCGDINVRDTQSYCTRCHAAYMREWRKTHRLVGEARLKSNCRSYTNVYINRGIIKKAPCARCGNVESQAHHGDYSKPLEVIWLCRSCHLKLHGERI
jgi:hypothetical protein